VFAHAPQNAYWVDASTIRPDVATELAEQARAAGLKPLDAPVSGGEQGAIDGALSILVGGEHADFDVVHDERNASGKTIILVRPSVKRQSVKTAYKLMGARNNQLLVEAVVFVEAYVDDTSSAPQA